MAEEYTDFNYVITTAYMGFGHLRAAHNLAALGNGAVIRVDRPPFVTGFDKFVWNATQRIHTYASRDAESRNQFLYRRFEELMRLPDDHKAPSESGVEFIYTLSKLGLGSKLRKALDVRSSAVVHTFYLSAMTSVYHGFRGSNFLLICDADIHRVWAPLDSGGANLRYFVPTTKAADRLMSYGVETGSIFITGFPLPPGNRAEGGPEEYQKSFELRKSRIKPGSSGPITVMFPFSGSGAYSNILAEMVAGMIEDLKRGDIRLIISCGDNGRALRQTENLLTGDGIDKLESVKVIFDEDLYSAFDKFNMALNETDVVVTKPGELIFYSALGLPMLLLGPIGGHEVGNREYLLKSKCAVDLVSAHKLAQWLREARSSGFLLELAQNGFDNIPRNGGPEIERVVKTFI